MGNPAPSPQRQEAKGSHGTALVVIVIALAAVASLILRAQTAIVSYPDAGHDDGLFVRLAYSIAQGEWLGPYDKMTLAKGPAYPLFLAITGAAGVQAKLAEHAVYLIGSGVMAYVLWLLTRSRVAGAALFVLLAFNPYAWTDHLARVTRDSLYLGLPLLVVASASWLLLHRVRSPGTYRARDLVVMFAIGVAAGLYWLTKEEGIWLAPSILVLGLASLWHALRFPTVDATLRAGTSSAAHRPPGRLRGPRAWAFRRLLVAVGVVALGGVVTLGSVAAMNWASYGVPLLNDFRDGNLPAAVGALGRIETGTERRYVIVPKAAREAAYEVSPAAAELEPFLEGPLQNWVAPGCAVTSRFPDATEPAACDDFYAGWFYWAFRDAVALAGHWDSASHAQAFLGRIADEIDEACDDGRLTCSEPHGSVIPELDLGTVREALDLVPEGLRILIVGGAIGYAHSEGDPINHQFVARLMRGQLAPAEPRPMAISAAGWVSAWDELPSVSVTSQSTPHTSTIERLPGQDVIDSYGEAGEPGRLAARFVIETDCLAADCQLIVASSKGRRTFMTNELTAGFVDTPTFAFNLDTVTQAEGSQDAIVSTPRHPAWIAVTRAIGDGYARLLPIGLAMAVGGLLLGALVRGTRRRFGLVWVVALACAVAVLLRTVLVAVIEVTSWPGALVDGYLGPASPFLLTFIACGIFLLLAAIRNLVVRREPEVRH